MYTCYLGMSRNPVPRIDWGGGGGDLDGGSCRGHGRGENCVNFKPPCEDSWLDTHKIDAGGKADDVEGECSGDWTGGQIVDEVGPLCVSSDSVIRQLS